MSQPDPTLSADIPLIDTCNYTSAFKQGKSWWQPVRNPLICSAQGKPTCTIVQSGPLVAKTTSGYAALVDAPVVYRTLPLSYSQPNLRKPSIAAQGDRSSSATDSTLSSYTWLRESRSQLAPSGMPAAVVYQRAIDFAFVLI